MFDSKFNVCLSILIVLFIHKVQYTAGIIAGIDADPGEFLYAVSLRNETNKHYCGGSLVSRRHVLTAGHCLFTDRSGLDYEIEEMYDPSVIKAVIASIYSEWLDGEDYRAKKLWPHPEFNVTNRFSIMHDIGLVELFREVNTGIPAIGLPAQEVNYGTMATVIGWGVDNRDNAVNNSNKIARVLQKADMQVMETNDCVNVYLEKIPDFAFTAEAVFINNAFCCIDRHVNTCYRDSGSPLIQDDIVVGIVIFGNECREGSPDIFTSTFRYMDFIVDCIEGQCTADKNEEQLFSQAASIHTGL